MLLLDGVVGREVPAEAETRLDELAGGVARGEGAGGGGGVEEVESCAEPRVLFSPPPVLAVVLCVACGGERGGGWAGTRNRYKGREEEDLQRGS